MTQYSEARHLWHKFAQAEVNRPCVLNRGAWNGWDLLTNPGCVGGDFSSGVLFLALNPGNGSDAGPSREEQGLFSALHRFQDDASAFDRLNDAYFAGLRDWRVARYIREMKAPMSEIAFINVIPWRTSRGVKGKEWRHLAELAWPWVSQQIELLKPKNVVVLGKGTFRLLSPEMKARVGDEFVIARSRGDFRTSPAAVIKINALKERFDW